MTENTEFVDDDCENDCECKKTWRQKIAATAILATAAIVLLLVVFLTSIGPMILEAVLIFLVVGFWALYVLFDL